MSGPRRLARRVGDFFLLRTPRILISDTYQVILAFALAGMGLGSLAVLLSPGSHAGAIGTALSSQILRGLWGVSLLSGGVAQLIGLQRSARDPERFGLAMTGIGCVVYALALLSTARTAPGMILAGVFALMAGGYFLRLKVSSVARRMEVT